MITVLQQLDSTYYFKKNSCLNNFFSLSIGTVKNMGVKLNWIQITKWFFMIKCKSSILAIIL